jgi:putative intracellular protease/amidase
LTAAFFEAGKVVSAVCHGPSGLPEVMLSGDEYLISGKRVTGFSWKEEELARREKTVPYNLEEELRKRGANYGKSSIPFKSYVAEDGLLITGQNPASASAVGEVVVKKLRAAG